MEAEAKPLLELIFVAYRRVNGYKHIFSLSADVLKLVIWQWLLLWEVLRYFKETVRFKDYSVIQVLVGLHRIGVVGLSEALKKAEDSGLQDREAILDAVIEHLARRNYIPETRIEAYRKAIWREYLRRRGENFSEFFSEIEVIIRGEADADRERFVELVTSVLAEFELRPVIVEYAQPSTEGSNPQLLIGGETIVRGITNRSALKKAVHQSLSDW